MLYKVEKKDMQEICDIDVRENKGIGPNS